MGCVRDVTPAMKPGVVAPRTRPAWSRKCCLLFRDHERSFKRRRAMEMPEFISNARDAMSARRVYSEPYEKDGVTIITAAKVSGGGGGGSGGDASGGTGSGGGFGLSATPVGAYVIKNGDVTWLPAIDINRVILGGQIIAIVMLMTMRTFMRRRMYRKMAEQFAGRRRFGPKSS
jgi:uncharacterized spore protein YtfJ